ncbi:MAG: DUF4347 domain-containing protein [Leptolyngbyaceae cyanobacterium CSU_1_3]|nr:DUF4347 domain-containing protein [Leptolyngbyaceae cyanobacterium CSU_1_3]
MNPNHGISTSAAAPLTEGTSLPLQNPAIASQEIKDPLSTSSLRTSPSSKSLDEDSAIALQPTLAPSDLPAPPILLPRAPGEPSISAASKLSPDDPTVIPAPGAPFPLAPSLSGQIVFIDPTLPGYEKLVAGTIAGINVVVLDPDRDGIAQITQVLAQATKVSAIHIVSPGGAGGFTIGAAQVSRYSLNIYKNSIQQWSNSFTPDADILLYGSNIGAGAAGTAFTKKFSEIAKAAVAASNDKTGKGGDWVLEVNTGAIAPKLPFKLL